MFANFVTYSILVTASVFIITNVKDCRIAALFILINIFIEFIISLSFFIYVMYTKSIIYCNFGSYILLGNTFNNTFTIGYSIITFYHHLALFTVFLIFLYILLVLLNYDFSNKYITFTLFMVFQVLFLLSFILKVIFFLKQILILKSI